MSWSLCFNIDKTTSKKFNTSKSLKDRDGTLDTECNCLINWKKEKKKVCPQQKNSSKIHGLLARKKNDKRQNWDWEKEEQTDIKASQKKTVSITEKLMNLKMEKLTLTELKIWPILDR